MSGNSDQFMRVSYDITAAGRQSRVASTRSARTFAYGMPNLTDGTPSARTFALDSASDGYGYRDDSPSARTFTLDYATGTFYRFGSSSARTFAYGVPNLTDGTSSARTFAQASAVSASAVFQSEENDCPICFDRLSLGGSTALGCGHQFHASCVVMLEGLQQKCPVCRSDSRWPLRTQLNGLVNAESHALRVLLEAKSAQNTLLEVENISLKAEASALKDAEPRSLGDSDMLIEILQLENQRLRSENEQHTVRLDAIRSYRFSLRAAVLSVMHTFYSVLFGHV